NPQNPNKMLSLSHLHPPLPSLLLKSTANNLVQSAFACREILMDQNPCKSVIFGGFYGCI
ncbi:LOW QUALITY PROTEIN: hypothetical protein HID58_067203, partial [Brassica napus]